MKNGEWRKVTLVFALVLSEIGWTQTVVVEPRKAVIGDRVVVRGEGFAKRERIKIEVFGESLKVRCDSEGRFEKSFTVKPQTGGKKPVVVLSDEAVLTAHFMIKPRITLVSPSEGRPRDPIVIEGDGFMPNEYIRIGFGTMRRWQREKAREDGRLRVDSLIPSLSFGKHEIELIAPKSRKKIRGLSVFLKERVSVFPEKAEIGTEVDVVGEGFFADEYLRIDFGRCQTIATAKTDALGRFRKKVVVPESPGGCQNIDVVSIDRGFRASGIFTVEGGIERVSPNPIEIGEVLEVSGWGFLPNQKIVVASEGVKVDRNGRFTFVFTPDNRPAGRYLITVRDRERVVTASFTVKGGIKLIPESGAVGSLVTVKGSGFEKKEEIRIDFGERKDIVRAWTDQNGSFSIAFKVPFQKGRIPVTAIGIRSFEKDTDLFLILP